jgi:hypothetical protein
MAWVIIHMIHKYGLHIVPQTWLPSPVPGPPRDDAMFVA